MLLIGRSLNAKRYPIPEQRTTTRIFSVSRKLLVQDRRDGTTPTASIVRHSVRALVVLTLLHPTDSPVPQGKSGHGLQSTPESTTGQQGAGIIARSRKVYRVREVNLSDVITQDRNEIMTELIRRSAASVLRVIPERQVLRLGSIQPVQLRLRAYQSLGPDGNELIVT